MAVFLKLPSYFIKISQSEIVNLKEIERFNITPNGLVEIHLKNKETTYSSRRYLKAIKEKLQWKSNFLNQAQRGNVEAFNFFEVDNLWLWDFDKVRWQFF